MTPDNKHFLTFTVPGVAQPAGSKRYLGRSNAGKAIIADANPAAAGWKERVALVAAQARDEVGWSICTGPLDLNVTIYRARPKSHYGKNGQVKATAPPYPTTRPDRGKVLRAIEDALAGIIYADDAQIVGGFVRKRWDMGGAALVVICVERLD